MPVRGLRDTAPFLDGIPGDPYGGINSASLRSHVEPNSGKDFASQTRHLVDGGLAATMAMPGDKTVNDEGKRGLLSKAQRDDLSVFFLDYHIPLLSTVLTPTNYLNVPKGFRPLSHQRRQRSEATPTKCLW